MIATVWTDSNLHCLYEKLYSTALIHKADMFAGL